ncbi:MULTISPECIES: hypothetical protein [unclassified Leucobacter]|uniref:hypothetical protein n=1 Tax=unclassified Leucobacter TaxID=2621730 RepID=UPI003017C7F4
MSHEEKNTWAFGIIAPLGFVAYLTLSYINGDGPLDPKGYLWPMIWSIIGAIVAGILAGIVIGIVDGTSGLRGAGRVDRRDKEIGWLGDRVGNSFITIGGSGAIVLCFIEAPHVYIANALYLCFILAAILQTITKLIAYRRGF